MGVVVSRTRLKASAYAALNIAFCGQERLWPYRVEMSKALPNQDWKPSPQEHADGTCNCRLLIQQLTSGMLIDGGFREALHYDHSSKHEAEECARLQIIKLRQERDGI
jgi:hypothetical protein